MLVQQNFIILNGLAFDRVIKNGGICNKTGFMAGAKQKQKLSIGMDSLLIEEGRNLTLRKNV